MPRLKINWLFIVFLHQISLRDLEHSCTGVQLGMEHSSSNSKVTVLLQDQLSMKVILHLILTRITSVIRNRSQGNAVILISFCLQLQLIFFCFIE